MARYDRITPLATPVREAVFSGWSILRDLDGRRDADAGRRARLRFLAYRPLRRLLDRGLAEVPPASFERQIDSVHAELGMLSPRDPERIRLAEYLHLLRQRTPDAAGSAALSMGEHAEGRGHNHAAGEFYAAARETAVQCGLPALQVRAKLRLGLLAHATGAAGAGAALQEAARIPATLADEALRIEALEALATGGDAESAAAALDELASRSARGPSLEMRAWAAAALARCEMAQGRVPRALEVCWHSFIGLNDPEQRFRASRTLASALARMGQLGAADLCLQRVEAEASEADRLQLQVDAACNAGYADVGELFDARRSGLLAELEEVRAECVFYAEAHLDLAAAALECGNFDSARDHLRLAIDAARQSHRTTALARAEQLLSRLEQPSASRGPHVSDDSGVARRIAAALFALSAPLTHAGS